MSLGNTPRKEIFFFVEANKSFAFSMAFLKEDGTPYSLEDQGARLVITDVVNIEAVVDLAKSQMQFNLQAADLTLDPGVYALDVTLVPLNGYTVPLFKGSFEIGPNVDQDATNVYSALTVDPGLVITMDGYAVVNVSERN